MSASSDDAGNQAAGNADHQEIIVDPDPRILEEYELKKSQIEIDRSKLKLLKSTRATTLDRVKIDLLANIEDSPFYSDEKASA